MNQRGVTLITTYLGHRPLGRIVEVRKVANDDYIVAIEDARDGRVHLIHSSRDLRRWFESFLEGECLQPVAGICVACDRLHMDRDVDGEILAACLRCAGELTVLGALLFLHTSSDGD